MPGNRAVVTTLSQVLVIRNKKSTKHGASSNGIGGGEAVQFKSTILRGKLLRVLTMP